jgi:cellulose synthase/poly-beta-1,6-N-acetylglucosamine synthase-like glycosyltransferase
MDELLEYVGQWLTIGSAFLVFIAYLGYPILLFVVAFFRPRPSVEPGPEPTVTVLIAAYNEEAAIGEKLANTLALDYPPDKLTVMVASDASSDRTDDIVKECAARDSRVRLLRVPDRNGKTGAQNRGVRECGSEIVVFSDAASMYDRQALRYLVAHYPDNRVGAVSGRYKYIDSGRRSPTAAGSSLFWGYENVIKELQSRISTLTGCSGCIYSVRRDLYQELPPDACSDIVEPLTLVQRGYRVVFEGRALAYEETTKTIQEEFSMRVRVLSRGIGALILMRDLLRFWKYGWISIQLLLHKVSRWMVPLYLALFFLGVALLSLQHVWAMGLLAAQVVFYSTGALFTRVSPGNRLRVFDLPVYFCTLCAATVISVIHLVRGEKHSVWETVRTST